MLKTKKWSSSSKTKLHWVYKIVMKKIYLLESTLRDTCFFIQDCPEEEEGIMGRAMGQRWKPFGNDYQPIKLELR